MRADPNTVRGQIDAIQSELDAADVTGFFDRIDAHLAHIRHLLDEAPTTNCHINGFCYRIVFDGHQSIATHDALEARGDEGGVTDKDCSYFASPGIPCNKCGRVHRGRS